MATTERVGAGLSASGRYAWLDIARGAALLAMAIYHFTFDLAMFGLIDPSVPVETPWREFARAIAGSFLFLVGVGIVIGHGRGVRWRPFWRRFAMIAGAAGLITAGTFVAARFTGAPSMLIYHGILHMIALGSLAALALVRAPWWIAAGAAVAALWLGASVALPFGMTFGIAWSHPGFDFPALWWIGLSTWRQPSVDFVPFFPAFAAVALGVMAAKLGGLAAGGGARRSGERTPLALRPLAVAGRHSLIVYLAHQPILIGLIYLALLVIY